MGSVALMLTGGGEHVSDLDMLRSSPGVFGTVASNATISRFFERTVTNSEVFEYGFATMARELRSRVWEAARERNPALAATALNPLIIDLDATLVTSHSDKEQAVGTYKGGYGFAPFVASVDYGAGRGGGEVLATLLRPGNAGANSADDHIKIFTAACQQLPDAFYDQNGALIGEKVLVRTDSAGASRKFLHYLHSLGVQFSVSYPVPVMKARMIAWINDKKYWQPALDQTWDERADAWVVNATDVLGLTDYPAGTNLYLRAEPLHPGARATLLDTDGHRVTAFLTNSPRWHGPTLDVRHRARGRCENRIKTLKNTGLGKLPFFDFHANQAWVNIATLAMNLLSWLQLAMLPNGHPGRGWDVKRWRYRIFATAGKLITRKENTVIDPSDGARGQHHHHTPESDQRTCPATPKTLTPTGLKTRNWPLQPPRTTPSEDVEPDTHPATTGHPHTPKTVKSVRQRNKTRPRQQPHPHAKSGLMGAEKANYPVARMARLLGVSRSDAWRRRRLRLFPKIRYPSATARSLCATAPTPHPRQGSPPPRSGFPGPFRRDPPAQRLSTQTLVCDRTRP